MTNFTRNTCVLQKRHPLCEIYEVLRAPILNNICKQLLLNIRRPVVLWCFQEVINIETLVIEVTSWINICNDIANIWRSLIFFWKLFIMKLSFDWCITRRVLWEGFISSSVKRLTTDIALLIGMLHNALCGRTFLFHWPEPTLPPYCPICNDMGRRLQTSWGHLLQTLWGRPHTV